MMFLFRCCMNSGCSRRSEVKINAAAEVVPTGAGSLETHANVRLLPTAADEQSARRFVDYSGCGQHVITTQPLITNLLNTNENVESVDSACLLAELNFEEVYCSGESGFGEIADPQKSVGIDFIDGNANDHMDSDATNSVAPSRDSLLVSSCMSSFIEERQDSDEEHSDSSPEVKYVADIKQFQFSLAENSSCYFCHVNNAASDRSVNQNCVCSCSAKHMNNVDAGKSSPCELLKNIQKTSNQPNLSTCLLSSSHGECVGKFDSDTVEPECKRVLSSTVDTDELSVPVTVVSVDDVKDEANILDDQLSDCDFTYSFIDRIPKHISTRVNVKSAAVDFVGAKPDMSIASQSESAFGRAEILGRTVLSSYQTSLQTSEYVAEVGSSLPLENPVVEMINVSSDIDDRNKVGMVNVFDPEMLLVNGSSYDVSNEEVSGAQNQAIKSKVVKQQDMPVIVSEEIRCESLLQFSNSDAANMTLSSDVAEIPRSLVCIPDQKAINACFSYSNCSNEAEEYSPSHEHVMDTTDSSFQSNLDSFVEKVVRNAVADVSQHEALTMVTDTNASELFAHSSSNIVSISALRGSNGSSRKKFAGVHQEPAVSHRALTSEGVLHIDNPCFRQLQDRSAYGDKVSSDRCGPDSRDESAGVVDCQTDRKSFKSKSEGTIEDLSSRKDSGEFISDIAPADDIAICNEPEASEAGDVLPAIDFSIQLQVGGERVQSLDDVELEHADEVARLSDQIARPVMDIVSDSMPISCNSVEAPINVESSVGNLLPEASTDLGTSSRVEVEDLFHYEPEESAFNSPHEQCKSASVVQKHFDDLTATFEESRPHASVQEVVLCDGDAAEISVKSSPSPLLPNVTYGRNSSAVSQVVVNNSADSVLQTTGEMFQDHASDKLLSDLKDAVSHDDIIYCIHTTDAETCPLNSRKSDSPFQSNCEVHQISACEPDHVRGSIKEDEKARNSTSDDHCINASSGLPNNCDIAQYGVVDEEMSITASCQEALNATQLDTVVGFCSTVKSSEMDNEGVDLDTVHENVSAVWSMHSDHVSPVQRQIGSKSGDRCSRAEVDDYVAIDTFNIHNYIIGLAAVTNEATHARKPVNSIVTCGRDECNNSPNSDEPVSRLPNYEQDGSNCGYLPSSKSISQCDAPSHDSHALLDVTGSDEDDDDDGDDDDDDVPMYSAMFDSENNTLAKHENSNSVLHDYPTASHPRTVSDYLYDEHGNAKPDLPVEKSDESCSDIRNLSGVNNNSDPARPCTLHGVADIPGTRDAKSRKFSPTHTMVSEFFAQYVIQVDDKPKSPLASTDTASPVSTCCVVDEDVETALNELESILIAEVDHVSSSAYRARQDEQEVIASGSSTQNTSDATGDRSSDSTPRRKKSVRFLDSVGQDLASVVHIESTPEEKAGSVTEYLQGLLAATDRRARWAERHPRQSVAASRPWCSENPTYLRPLFDQPSSRPDYLENILRNRVLLDCCSFSDRDRAMMGVIRVANIAYDKSVSVRYTVDSWTTWSEVAAEYVPRSNDGTTDKFAFTIILPPQRIFDVGSRLEFALCYIAGTGDTSQVFWDNNNGLNYVIDCCLTDEPEIGPAAIGTVE